MGKGSSGEFAGTQGARLLGMYADSGQISTDAVFDSSAPLGGLKYSPTSRSDSPLVREMEDDLAELIEQHSSVKDGSEWAKMMLNGECVVQSVGTRNPVRMLGCLVPSAKGSIFQAVKGLSAPVFKIQFKNLIYAYELKNTNSADEDRSNALNELKDIYEALYP